MSLTALTTATLAGSGNSAVEWRHRKKALNQCHRLANRPPP